MSSYEEPLPKEKKVSKAFEQFVAACLEKDPAKRPTAKELLGHKFIKSANPSALTKMLEDVNEVTSLSTLPAETLPEG